MKAEQVTPRCTYHGEGIIWDAARRCLRWVDMLAGDVMSMDPGDGVITRRSVGSMVGAVRPRVGGGIVVSTERGFALIDADGGIRDLGELWTDAGVRMNEGGCDPQGRFYCGSMAYAETPGAGSLHRLDVDLSVATVLRGVTISNGLSWTPSGDEVYYVDSPTQRVDVYRFDAESGTMHDPRCVVRIDAAVGTPDGIAVDAEGGIWVALWGGHAVHRYLPDGRLDAVIEVPVERVTSCAFGGDDLDDLYITTSRTGLDDADQPQAGALFRARPGVHGLAAAPFGA